MVSHRPAELKGSRGGADRRRCPIQYQQVGDGRTKEIRKRYALKRLECPSLGLDNLVDTHNAIGAQT